MKENPYKKMDRCAHEIYQCEWRSIHTMVIKITRISGLKLKAEIDDFEIISGQIDETPRRKAQAPVHS
jgi:hypothetical protein